MTLDSGPLLTALMLGVLLAEGAARVVAGLYFRHMVGLMRGGPSPADLLATPSAAALSQVQPSPALVRPDEKANQRATLRSLLAMAGLSLLVGLTQSWIDLWRVYQVGSITLNRVLVLGAVYAWPLVMAWGLLRRWSWLRVALAIGACMLGVGALVMWGSTQAQSLTQVAGWLGGCC